MRIGVDCRLAGLRHAGIGRYIENLVQRLPQVGQDVTWVYFFHDAKQLQQVMGGVDLPANVEVKFAPIRHYSFAEQWQWPRVLNQAHLNLLHVPHFNVPLLYRGKLVVTIHDLLWHEYRGQRVTTLSPLWYWIKYWAYRLVATAAIQRATAVLVPAETIKHTLSRHYPSAEAKVVVTKEGIAEAFKTPVSRHPGKKQPELLYVGSLYPHKNIQVVIQALRLLPDYKLVLVGARNVFQDQTRRLARELHVSDRVEFVGYVTDAELRRRYLTATALVQPSLSEGFGLTGVEALAAGAPVLASNIPIFHEIYADAAVYFDPYSPADFVRAVAEVATHQPTSTQVARLVKQYSWLAMTKQTLVTYRQALAI